MRDLLLLVLLAPTDRPPVPWRCCPAATDCALCCCCCCDGCCCMGAAAVADAFAAAGCCSPAVLALGLLLPLESLLLLLSVAAPSFCISSRVSLSRSVTPAAPAACTCATSSFICSSDRTGAGAAAGCCVTLLGCRKG